MASEAKRPRRALRIALLTLAALLLLVLALVALAAWLLGTESGANALLPRLLERSGGTVTASGLHGRLIGPLRVERIVIERPNERIELHGVRLQWRARALLAQRLLHVESLHAERLIITSHIERKEEEPSVMPDSLALPLAVRVDQLGIAGGELRRGPATLATLGQLALGLRYQDGRYALDLQRFGARPTLENGSAQARVHGRLQLSATRPFPLDGRFEITSKAQMDERKLGGEGVLTLSGSLADLLSELELQVNDARATGAVLLHPFADRKLGKAELHARALDLSALDAALPKSALDIDLRSAEDGAGTLQLRNAKPATLEQHGMPLQALEIAFREIESGFVFERIHARLGSQEKQSAGSLDGSGRFVDGALDLTLATKELNLQRLDPRLQATRLTGTLAARHAQDRQEFEVALSEPLGSRPLLLEAQATLADAELAVRRIQLQAGDGRLNASGKISLDGKRDFRAEGELSRFSLHALGSFPQIPAMSLNGGFSLAGALEPQLRADLKFSIKDSQLAGQPLRGEGQAQLHGERLEVPDLLLSSGANRLHAQGRLAPDGNAELRFSLQAPQLDLLGPDFGGAIHAEGSARGSLNAPRVQLTWRANKARLPGAVQIASSQGKADVQLDRKAPFMLRKVEAELEASGLKQPERAAQQLSARLRFAPQPEAPLTLDVQASGLQANGTQVDTLVLNATGTTGNHVISSRIAQPSQQWEARAGGGLDTRGKNPGWEGRLENFQARGPIQAQLRAPAAVLLSAAQIRVTDLQLDLEGGRLALERLVRDQDGIETRGRIVQLQLGQLLPPSAIAGRLNTDLQLSGEWDLRYREELNGFLRLQRDRGDITVLGAVPVALGLGALRANVQADGGRIALDFEAAGERLGNIALTTSTQLGDGTNALALPDHAPLSGRARLDMPSLAWVGALIDPILRTDGRLKGDVSVGGSVAQPAISGRINGEALQFAHAELGLDLRRGRLDSEFSGERLHLRALEFEGAQGRLHLAGPIDFGRNPVADLMLQAEQFAVLNRPDRRLVLSGKTRLEWRDARGSAVGSFNVDSGFFDIGTANRPTLGEDVVIVGRDDQEQARATALAMDIQVRLGNGVVVRGRGLDAVLGGQVRLLSDAGEPLQAVGTLRVSKGTFSAYGRELAIEQGAVRFNGALNNPALDIVAMRRGQEVEAGVSVQGTVLAPRVTLVSEPAVPDAEKLAWLVLGRSLANAGTEDIGSLQEAAASLLTRGAAAGVQSRIASAFGLDTFSVGTTDDTLQERIVKVGKQLSSRLYLGYEHGLESAAGVLQLRYLLTPSLSLEAETGARSAFSLFYNLSFD